MVVTLTLCLTCWQGIRQGSEETLTKSEVNLCTCIWGFSQVLYNQCWVNLDKITKQIDTGNSLMCKVQVPEKWRFWDLCCFVFWCSEVQTLFGEDYWIVYSLPCCFDETQSAQRFLLLLHSGRINISWVCAITGLVLRIINLGANAFFYSRDDMVHSESTSSPAHQERCLSAAGRMPAQMRQHGNGCSTGCPETKGFSQSEKRSCCLCY